MSKCWGHGLHIFFSWGRGGGEPPSQKKLQKIIFSPEHTKFKKNSFVRIIFFLDNRSHLVLTTYVNIPFSTSLTRGGIYYQSK